MLSELCLQAAVRRRSKERSRRHGGPCLEPRFAGRDMGPDGVPTGARRSARAAPTAPGRRAPGLYDGRTEIGHSPPAPHFNSFMCSMLVFPERCFAASVGQGKHTGGGHGE